MALLESGIIDFRYVQLGDAKGAYDILENKLSNSKNNSLVESTREGYAVELEHILTLTGKKMHYIHDYRAKSKYKTNDSRLARKRRRIK